MTSGRVTATCVDVSMAGTTITFLCQDLLATSFAAGDSGGPVFSWPGGTDVTLYGIVWAGSGFTTAVFSAIQNIRT